MYSFSHYLLQIDFWFLNYLGKEISDKEQMVQNTFEGTYWFGSFINSDSISGEYKVSGNYTGILLSYTLPKFKLNFYK